MKRPHPALVDASPTPAWLDSPLRPEPRPRLRSDTTADLVVVGGGYSGLWTAVMAKERDPSREVVLLEAQRIGWAASGRNGGFCSASLTHGKDNGEQRFPEEINTLERLGRQNLTEIESAIGRYGIDCDFELTGALSVATEPHQVAWLQEANRTAGGVPRPGRGPRRGGLTHLPRGPVGTRRQRAGRPRPTGVGAGRHGRASGGPHPRGHPGRGPGQRRTGRRDGMAVRTSAGHTVRAAKVALGTNAFPSLVRRVRWHTVPVYDYALMTEPLSADQLASVGWRHRQGIDDCGNQFHYYRLTSDNRILWGGYDAIYHFGRRLTGELDHRPATFELLARQFFETFPQLEGLRFSHQWGGAIDTCTRFFAFYGTAYAGRAAYALGYTGLGVGATRFGANVMLDLLDGRETERTALRMVRTKPLPFPPEPFAFAGVQLTRWSLAAADRNAGSRNLWLRSLDRMGLGFDS